MECPSRPIVSPLAFPSFLPAGCTGYPFFKHPGHTPIPGTLESNLVCHFQLPLDRGPCGDRICVQFAVVSLECSIRASIQCHLLNICCMSSVRLPPSLSGGCCKASPSAPLPLPEAEHCAAGPQGVFSLALTHPVGGGPLRPDK